MNVLAQEGGAVKMATTVLQLNGSPWLNMPN